MWVKFEIKFENKKQEKSEKKKRDRKCNRWRCGLGKRRITTPAAAALIKNGILRGSSSDHPDQVMVKKSIQPVRHLLAVLYQPHPRHCDRHYWMHFPCNAVISPLTAILAGSQCCYLTWEVSLCKSPLHGSSGGEYLREGLARKIQNIFGRFHKKVEEEIQITFRKKSQKIWKKSERNVDEFRKRPFRSSGGEYQGEVHRDSPGKENYSHEKGKRTEVGRLAQKQVLVSWPW